MRPWSRVQTGVGSNGGWLLGRRILAPAARSVAGARGLSASHPAAHGGGDRARRLRRRALDREDARRSSVAASAHGARRSSPSSAWRRRKACRRRGCRSSGTSTASPPRSRSCGPRTTGTSISCSRTAAGRTMIAESPLGVLRPLRDRAPAAADRRGAGACPALPARDCHRRCVLRLPARPDRRGAERDRAPPDSRLPLPERSRRRRICTAPLSSPGARAKVSSSRSRRRSAPAPTRRSRCRSRPGTSARSSSPTSRGRRPRPASTRSAHGGPHLVDVDGRHAHDSGPLADRRLLRRRGSLHTSFVVT